ncbi:5-hydroxyisourate hydrolase-like [Lichtheimia corymbifera JMRC:FSU:9682]|uniref:5-hydroxyisourate hydrolase n=2 Tax=Lichtheimia TaxID=688353 RepID=A0A068RM60_9FUNG|nr:hydroxyisourate hydrolase [Lichtheimia ornata]KAJ8653670.1 hydroxyisourate hydrolase [Lichtheimia ornata]CDH51278.1 5-hydroxyisourate hydrolase-like [Lichtheimia corymbifera JMRC:FSU:9682]
MSASSRLAAVKQHLTPMSKSPITCHVLVASVGKPGEHVRVKIEKEGAAGAFSVLSTAETNDDGRCPNLLPSDYKVEKGVYRVTFETKEFFARKGEKCFYPYVQIVFEIEHPEQHYHIPLLISPYSYTTYRGS